MDLLSLIILIVVIGVLMYCVNRFIPMEPNIKQVLNVVVVIAVVLFVLSLFSGYFPNIHVGR
jgi:RsiW-degrading membrane proteinase PrsW (M82 family)